MQKPVQFSNMPYEVRLAWEVMTCRALRSTYDANSHPCRWFNQHYGPYPAYDWINNLPHPSDAVNDKEQSFDALCMGERFQVPELMSGCRKAPIMTIGINPNLTAYYPSPDGAVWCYPYFDNIVQYAYYFRHRAVCQEHFSLDFIKEHVVKGTEIIAEEDGKLIKAEFSLETGGVNLTIDYHNTGEQKLYFEKGVKVFVSPYDKDGFKKGEILAGQVILPENVPTRLYREPVGYYKRFQAIFDKFKSMAGNPIAKLPLRLGEDVCQADMIACASPGWGKWFTDKTREGIVKECIDKRKWLIFQLLQTRPKLIVFSGMSAFSMFYDVMKNYILTDLDLFGDTYELLKKCTHDQIRLVIPLGDGNEINSTLVISPHFSYTDNFRPQCRFSDEEWEEYSKQYPETFSKLDKLVSRNFSGTRKLIFMDEQQSPTKEDVGEAVWEILQDHLYAVEDLIAQIILSEVKKGNIAIEGKHFKRTEGACRFCANELFHFQEGCPYGKLTQKESLTAVDLNELIGSIFNS